MLKHVKITLAVFCAAAALTACKSSMKIKHLPYPEAERTEVVDNYFGTEVADPYRWLEDDRSEQTAAWVAAENAVTQNYLDQIPFREAMRARLTELWAYPWEGAPAKFGDYYYFTATTDDRTRPCCTARLRSTPSRRYSSIPTRSPRTERLRCRASLSRKMAATWLMRLRLQVRTGATFMSSVRRTSNPRAIS